MIGSSTGYDSVNPPRNAAAVKKAMDDDFETWFLANGGYIHPGVEIASDASTGTHMRVSDTGVLAADSLIVSCPHELTISWLNVISGSEAFLSRFDLGIVNRAINQVVIVRFFISNEYWKQRDSFWWPYIRSLPQPSEIHLLGTPLWYSDCDWKWIRGTGLEKSASRTEQMWRQEYETAMHSLQPMARSSTSEWSWDLYKWAATIMSSRSFPSSALANYTHVANQQGPTERKSKEREESIEPGSPVLIPGLDILNHRPFEKVTWQWGSVNSRLVNNKVVASGCQIYNNYGAKSNEELIMGYGFSLTDNPADCCILAAARRSSAEKPGNESSTAGDEEVLDSMDRFEESDRSTQWVRLYNDAIDRNGAAGASYVFSPRFLQNTAVALRNEREKAARSSCLVEQMDFAHPRMSRNKLKVMCVITMLLQKQHSDIVQYNSSLPQWPENEKQFHAARYRQGQLHILRAVNAALVDHLAGLVGLKGPHLRNVQVVRLEHTLSETPQPLLTDYRAVLNAGLGTRNPEKIKKRSHTEHALTAWLCGLWLWRTSTTVPSEGEPGSSFSNGMLQWLSLMGDVYEKSPCPKSTFNACQPTGNSPGIASDVESVQLALSLLDMIRAAVSKHPMSLYNNAALTQERLLWFLNIVREESVMAPNLEREFNHEGESGDANDELLLFLEYDRDSILQVFPNTVYANSPQP